MESPVASVEPLLRVAQLSHHCKDFLYSLGALLFGNDKENRAIPLLQAISTALPLWKKFVNFKITNTGKSLLLNTFNPFGLGVLAELECARLTVKTALPSCCIDDVQGHRIDVDALNALLARVPEPFLAGYSKPCVHLQPANAEGSLWVQNLL